MIATRPMATSGIASAMPMTPNSAPKEDDRDQCPGRRRADCLTLDQRPDHVALDRLNDGVDDDRPDQHRAAEWRCHERDRDGGKDRPKIGNEIRQARLEPKHERTRQPDEIKRAHTHSVIRMMRMSCPTQPKSRTLPISSITDRVRLRYDGFTSIAEVSR